jgi:membrane-bound ClpP family serine protease
MTRVATFGDAMIIVGGPEGFQGVPEDLAPKVLTPVLEEFESSADLNGYSRIMCESFVVPDLEIWWLENTETGAREFVDRETKQSRLGENPDGDKDDGHFRNILGMRSADDSPWKLVETYYDVLLGEERPLVQPVVKENRLLQMSASEAYAFGFSTAVANSQDDLKEILSLETVTRIETSWSEHLALWLTSPGVRFVFLLLAFLGAYVEFNTPGVGLPGAAALLCFGICFGAPYMTGLANVWEIALIAVGVALLLVELFVIPGFGVAGILGAAAVLVGILATFVPEEPDRFFPVFTPSLPATAEALRQGLATTVSALTASVIGMVLLSRVLPQTRTFRLIAPANPTPEEVQPDDPYAGVAYVGDVGKTVGPLRPAGKARFGTALVDVVTEGDYIAADASVLVIQRRGNRIVVRPVS